jgi:hypothetical protein
MHNLKSLLLRALVALAMFSGAAHAFAGPYYHVSIDTTALAGESGYLDFLFAGLGSSATPSAAISNASGDFDASNWFAYGAPQGSLASGLTLGNFDEFGQWAHFGGLLEFDVRFDGLNDPNAPGMDLSVALLGADQFSYAAGTSGNMVTFSLQPGLPDALTVDPDFAAVTAVPEPASLAQMAAGFVLLMGSLRRRRR